jgi:hypothetical protein
MRHFRERMMHKLMIFVNEELAQLASHHRQLFKYRLYMLIDKLFPVIANCEKVFEQFGFSFLFFLFDIFDWRFILCDIHCVEFARRRERSGSSD